MRKQSTKELVRGSSCPVSVKGENNGKEKKLQKNRG